jgi:hypothetical protein
VNFGERDGDSVDRERTEEVEKGRAREGMRPEGQAGDRTEWKSSKNLE